MRSKRVMGTAKVSRGARTVVSLVGAACGLAALGCGAGSTTGDAAAGDVAGDIAGDTAEDTLAEASLDSEVQALCVRNSDCDDARFCNGPERCAPGDMAADARGCAPAAMPACRSNEVCNEAMQRCAVNPDAGDGEGPVECDRDNDGVRAATPECGGADCDDNDRDRYPGNPERCGTDRASVVHDEDCNPCTVAGVSPDGDGDADGFVRDQCRNPFPEGSTAAPMGCDPRAVALDTSARMVTGVDCDDVNRSRNPNAPEVCGNGVDDNCNGSIDESMLVTVYRDRDNDGFGNRAEPSSMLVSSCPPPVGYVLDNSDCDDGPAGAATYPGATEICDRVINDCSARRSPDDVVRPEEDLDEDGFAGLTASCVGSGMTTMATALAKTDCDDTRGDVSPRAAEICDGIDNDCNAATAEEGAQTDCASALECHAGRCGFIDRLVSRDNAACALTRQRELVCWGGDDSDGVWRDGWRYLSSPRARYLYDWASVSIAQFVNGNNTACAVGTNGVVYCAGVNAQGQLGVSGPVPSLLPVAVPGVSDATTVSVGNQHTCATTRAGQVFCWGSNANGRLGDGTVTSHAPMVVPSLSRIEQVSLGTNHSCARDADGQVYCWGLNSNGAVGAGDTAEHLSPVRLAMPAPAREIEANGQTTCALLRDDTVACWGYNSRGQAAGAAGPNVLVPTRIAGVTGARALSVGNEHVCVLVPPASPASRGAGVMCWGSNTNGQSGRPSTSPLVLPAARVPGVDGLVSIAAGAAHTSALRVDGSVMGWGSNEFGQSNPTAVAGARAPSRPPEVLANFAPLPAQLALNQSNSCLRRVDGRVYCAGNGASLLLGDASVGSSNTLLRVAGVWDARSFALGGLHACIARADQTVECWGGNGFGQLGDGTLVDRAPRARVLGLNNAVEVAAGSSVSCARLNDGTATCWGNANGIATGATLSGLAQPRPQGIVGLTSIEQISALGLGGCARMRDRSVWCWGRNNVGQTGGGTMTATSVNTPVRVLREPAVGETGPQPLANVQRVFAGSERACVLTTAGMMLCWGRNENLTVLFNDPATSSPIAVQRSLDVMGHLALSNLATLGFSRSIAASLRSAGQLPSAQQVLLRGRVAGESDSVTTFANIDQYESYTPRDVALGTNGGWIYTTTGELYAFGANNSGHLAVGSFAPTVTLGPTSRVTLPSE